MRENETKEIYLSLIEKFGEKQIIVAIEELSELQKELCKSLRGKENKENIIEEIADVLIMIDQIIMYYDLNAEEIYKVVDYKITRTKDRLLNAKQ